MTVVPAQSAETLKSSHCFLSAAAELLLTLSESWARLESRTNSPQSSSNTFHSAKTMKVWNVCPAAAAAVSFLSPKNEFREFRCLYVINNFIHFNTLHYCSHFLLSLAEELFYLWTHLPLVRTEWFLKPQFLRLRGWWSCDSPPSLGHRLTSFHVWLH